MIDRFRQLLDRLGEYAWWQVLLELAVIWLAVYAIARFVRGTRAAGAIKGMIVLAAAILLILGLFGQADLFPRLSIIIQWFLGFAVFTMVVIFAPELRRALLRLGERALSFSQRREVGEVIDAVVTASRFLSKNKFGAIVAIERRVGLRDAIENGRTLNADVSAQLLNSVFWPNSPLHDMGVVIRGDKIVAASVPFPLVDPGELPDKHLGTRHRAAIGLSRQTDALVVVVSEETGSISVAEGGRIDRWLTPEALRDRLVAGLSEPVLGGGVSDDAGMSEISESEATKPAAKSKRTPRSKTTSKGEAAIGGIGGA